LISIIKNDIILNNKYLFLFLLARKSKTMNNKKLTILVALLVIIVAVILFAVLSNKSKTPSPLSNVSPSTNSAQDDVNANVAAPVNTEAEAVPEGVDAATIVPATPAQLSVMPGSPEAPKQEVVNASEIPATAIKLTVSDKGFSPKEFTLQAGQKASLAVTAEGGSTHVFIFPNASLMALTMMVSGGETKVMEFTAPAAGSYTFRDDIPTFRDNTGTMIVK